MEKNKVYRVFVKNEGTSHVVFGQAEGVPEAIEKVLAAFPTATIIAITEEDGAVIL